MYTIEYIKSKGRASEHMYHKDIVDYYLLLKDNERVFSKKENWDKYCFVLEIDNLNKEILIKKTFTFIVNTPFMDRYSCTDSDYWNIKNELFAYIEEVKVILDILDYKIRV